MAFHYALAASSGEYISQVAPLLMVGWIAFMADLLKKKSQNMLQSHRGNEQLWQIIKLWLEKTGSHHSHSRQPGAAFGNCTLSKTSLSEL